jgi:hypothetical protein
LGSASENDEEAFASVPILADNMANAPRDEVKATFYPDPSPLGVPPWDTPLWGDLGAILSRAWFHRLWILQEVHSSTNLVILCGRQRIQWEKLVSFVEGFSKHQIPSSFMAGIAASTVVRLGFNSVLSLGVLKNDFDFADMKDNGSYKMSHLLCSLRERIATNAVDKIYGALSMMPSDVQESLIVDIAMTPAQVYTAFSKCMFNRGDASLILCQASHSMKEKDLPSWCPNFAERHDSIPFGAFYMINGFATGHEPVPSSKEGITWRQDWDEIEVTGFEVDVIQEVVSLDYAPALDTEACTAALEWDEACLNMVKRHRFDPSIKDLVLQVLCEARVAGGRIVMHKYPWQPASQWVHDYNDWRSALQGALEKGTLTWSTTAQRFDYTLNRTSRTRRVFISRGGYIGLGPPATEAGDLICTLYGRPTPFILRLNADRSTYRLLGEAYVNGIMDGELLTSGADYSLTDKPFIIK